MIVFLLLILLLFIYFVNPLNILWRYLYPLKHEQIIWDYSEKYDLDPYLVLSIIKIESKFDNQAVSRKGALGLMQLMPETAYWIAETKGFTLEDKDLTDPTKNIALGTWYLDHLIKSFDSEIVAVAAYNAGRGNVQKWLDNGLWDGTLKNASQIPFKETREYVLKVILARQKYHEIYYDSEK